MDPRVALDLGVIKVHWYGVLVTLGIFLGTYIASLELRRRGYSPNVAWDGVLWVAGLGIVGARLYHVFSVPNDGSGSGWAHYSQNPIQILAIWNGGLGIFGGLLGGLIGVLIVARRYRVDLRALCDSIAPGLALGQAIGRWGNYFNQELYGGPTGLSWWGITIDPLTASERRAQTSPICSFIRPKRAFIPRSSTSRLGTSSGFYCCFGSVGVARRSSAAMSPRATSFGMG